MFACSLAFFFFSPDSGLKAETNQLRFTSPWMLYVSRVDVYTRTTGLDSLWHEWREISGQSMIYLTYLRHLDLVGCSCCIASVYFPQLQSNREVNIRRRLLCHWEQFFKCCLSFRKILCLHECLSTHVGSNDLQAPSLPGGTTKDVEVGLVIYLRFFPRCWLEFSPCKT